MGKARNNAIVAQPCFIKNGMSQFQQWLWQSEGSSGDTVTRVVFLQEWGSVVLNPTCVLLICLLSCFALMLTQRLHFGFPV